jgi:hypothetical protein
MKTSFALLSLFLLSGCTDSASDRTATQNTSSAATPAPVDFRKDMFTGIHREAVSFQVGQTQAPKKLRVEMEMVRHGLESEPERNLFNLFEKIYMLQSDLVTLENLKATTERSASQSDPEQQSATIDQLDRMGIDTKKLQHLAGALAEMAEANKQGFVIVQSSLKPDAAPADLVQRYSLQTKKGNFGSYIPYEDTWVKLGALMNTSLELAGRMIYNNGRVPEKPKS